MTSDRGELDFAGTRAAALLSRSFLGARWDRLAACRNLVDLSQQLFPDRSFSEPNRFLALALQRAVLERATGEMLAVISVLRAPAALVTQPLKDQRYRWLKLAARARAQGESPPAPPDFGGCSTLVPSPRSDEIPEAVSRERLPEIEARLDRRAGEELLQAVRTCEPPSEGLVRWVGREVALRNASWALRMRFHYGWSLSRALPWFIGDAPEFRAAAAEVFSLPREGVGPWQEWRFASFLPPARGGPWNPDPVFFEVSVRRWSLSRAWHLFHAELLSVASLYAFCRLKEAEAESLTSLIEAVALELPEARRRELAGGEW